MFWKKNPKSKVEQPINTLTIRTKTTGIHSWTVRPWDGKEKTEPWRRFYKWYFSNKPGDFVMKYREGEAMFRRDEIIHFDIRTGTELVKA